MAYTDFTLESAESELGVTARPGPIFPDPRARRRAGVAATGSGAPKGPTSAS